MVNLFEKVLRAFDEMGLWDDGVELIGSWSFYLYQKHFGVRAFPFRTQDVDFLLPRPYPERTKIDIASTLAHLGFHADIKSSGVIHFLHPEFKIEFLTPERGKGSRRARPVKPLGIRVVQLRFLDMLFDNPVTVRVESISVRMPSPVNFCLHKLIVAQRRRGPNKREKKEKDIQQALYVLEVLRPQNFKRARENLSKKWNSYILKSLREAWNLFPLDRDILERHDITPQM